MKYYLLVLGCMLTFSAFAQPNQAISPLSESQLEDLASLKPKGLPAPKLAFCGTQTLTGYDSIQYGDHTLEIRSYDYDYFLKVQLKEGRGLGKASKWGSDEVDLRYENGIIHFVTPEGLEFLAVPLAELDVEAARYCLGLYDRKIREMKRKKTDQ